MKFLLFLVAFHLLMMNSFCRGVTLSDLVKSSKENHTYLACAFNDDKPNCVKADVVIPDYCKIEFNEISKNDTIKKDEVFCIEMKINGFYQYKLGTITDVQLARDEHCSGTCSYGCAQLEVELLNGDVVAKIPICKYQILAGFIVERDI